jgi:uncharacterized oligopeptide transporter (OPT) family protein
MIKHLIVYFLASLFLMHFVNFSFFQVMVICLLIGIYNMLYTLMRDCLDINIY